MVQMYSPFSQGSEARPEHKPRPIGNKLKHFKGSKVECLKSGPITPVELPFDLVLPMTPIEFGVSEVLAMVNLAMANAGQEEVLAMTNAGQEEVLATADAGQEVVHVGQEEVLAMAKEAKSLEAELMQLQEVRLLR